jgi:hypothetical protein
VQSQQAARGKGEDEGAGMDVKPKRGTEAVGVETGRVAAEWLMGRKEGTVLTEGTECEVWWEGEVRRSGWREDAVMATKAKNKGSLGAETGKDPVPNKHPKKRVISEKAQRPSTTSKRKRKQVSSEDDPPPDQDPQVQVPTQRPAVSMPPPGQDTETNTPSRKTKKQSSSSSSSSSSKKETQPINGVGSQARQRPAKTPSKQDKSNAAAPAEAATRSSKRLKKVKAA